MTPVDREMTDVEQETQYANELYAPTKEQVGVPTGSGELSAFLALRDEAKGKVSEDIAASVSNYELAVQAYGASALLEKEGLASIEAKKEELRREYKDKVFTDPERTAAIIQEMDAQINFDVTGVRHNDPLVSSVEVLSSIPKSEDGKYISTYHANEIAAQIYMQEHLDKIKHTIVDNPLSSYLSYFTHVLAFSTFGSLNQDTKQVFDGAGLGEYSLGEGLLDGSKFAKNYIEAIGAAENPLVLKHIIANLVNEGASLPDIRLLEVLERVSTSSPGYFSETGTLDALFSVPLPISVASAVTLLKTSAKIATKGAVLATTAVVNPKLAGKLIAEGVSGTKVGQSVINREEAIRASLSLGHPVDDSILKGLAPEVREAVLKETQTFVDKYKGMTPSLLSEAQKLKEAESLVANLKLIDRSIYSIDVLKATDDGIELSILRHNSVTGKPHASVEEALKYAADRNIAVEEIVPVSSLSQGASASKSVGGVVSTKQVVSRPAIIHGETGKPLFTKTTQLDNGTTLPKNVEATRAVSSNLVSGAVAVMSKMGMQRKVLFAHESDLESLKGLGTDWDTAITRVMASDKASSTTNAWHVPVGTDTSLIFIKSRGYKNKVSAAITLGHELGHAFVAEFLKKGENITSRAWDDMFDDFMVWQKNQDVTTAEFLATHHTPDDLRSMMKTYMKEFGDPASNSALLKYAQGKQEYVTWLRNFEEFFSQQFSKVLLSDAKVQNAFFSKIKEGLIKLYDEVKTFFGKQGLDVGAFPSIEKFLASHAEQVVGKQRPNYFALSDDEINMAMAGMDELTTYSSKSVIQRGKDKVRRMMKGRVTSAKPATTETYLIKEKRTEGYLYSDVGTHTSDEIAGSSWFKILDPKQKITTGTYRGGLVAMFTKDREAAAIASYFKSSTKGLSLKEQKEVSNVLAKVDALSNNGDNLKHLEIDADFLRAEGLSDGQIKMYARVREIRDILWAKHERLLRDELRRQGYELRLSHTDAVLGTVDGPIHIYKNSLVVKGLIGKGEVKKIFDMNTSKFVSLEGRELDRLLSEGFQIGKLHTPVDGVKHVIVPRNGKISPLNGVLPYRPHEYSRIYTDDYFITYKTIDEVDGVAKETTHTVRTATTAKEATEFTNAVNKSILHLREAQSGSITMDVALSLATREMQKFGRSGEELVQSIKSGEFPLDAQFSYHFNREKEDALSSVLDEHIHNGRMFESERGRKLLSVDVDRENTMSPLESLGVEISVITKKASFSDWRKSSMEKYLNTFVDPKNRTGDIVKDFMEAPVRYPIGSKEYALAESERNYVQSAINGRSMEERVMAARARGVVEWLEGREGVVGKVSEKVFTGMQLRKADPIQFLRTINFHLSLGMFNVSQLLVQSIGMLNAAYIHPVFGVKAAFSYPAIRLAMMSDNPEVWRKLYKTLAPRMEEDEFMKLIPALNNSGILSSLKNTALYNNADGFDNAFKEYGGGLFNKVSTMPFNRGEEMSRVVAWDISRREWITANKGADWTTNEALNAITLRMDDYTMGMTQANIANYQRGVLSIPFQFLQYNLKMASEVGRAAFGKSRVFTQADASKMLLGNLIMWGTAGNGLRGLGDEWFGENLNEEQKLALTQGAVASLISLASDGEAKLAVGSRFGSFNWYRETIENIASGEMDIPEFMFGVTRSNFTKATDVLADMAAIWHPVEGMSSEQAVEGMRVLTGLASGLSNYNKAYVLTHNGGRLYNKRGDLLTTVTEQEAYASMFGISPAEIPDMYYKLDTIREDSADGKERVARYRHLQMLYLRAISEGDYKSGQSYRYAMSLLMTEDKSKTAALVNATKKMGGTSLTREVHEKLVARGISQPVSATDSIGE